MRAVALHPDVLVVTSALLQVNCVIVRGKGAREDDRDSHGYTERSGSEGERSASDRGSAETFVIDSPVLPDELEALPTLLEQAGFPQPRGLLATHGDWDHLLGRLAFPDRALGCAGSTAQRLAASPGEAQRELRTFDEELIIERPRPLALGSVQGLPVPGRCEIGELELQLHPADGHTADGMAIVIAWAGVLVASDYLSGVELPTLGEGGSLESYLATLERLRPHVRGCTQVVPGHGPVLDRRRAMAVLEEDRAYLLALGDKGASAELPPRRRRPADRRAHAQNVARL